MSFRGMEIIPYAVGSALGVYYVRGGFVGADIAYATIGASLAHYAAVAYEFKASLQKGSSGNLSRPDPSGVAFAKEAIWIERAAGVLGAALSVSYFGGENLQGALIIGASAGIAQMFWS